MSGDVMAPVDEAGRLAVIVESKALVPAEVYAKGGIETLLSRIEQEVRATKRDISTVKGRLAVRSLAYQVARSKTALDSMGKELTEGWRKQTDAVNADRRLVRERLDALADEVRAPLERWEAREKQRVDAHEAALMEIRRAPGGATRATSVEIAQRLVELRNPPSRDWQEFEDRAAEVYAEQIAFLEGLLEERKAEEEAEAREAARLAAEAEAARLAAEEARKQREEEIAAAAAERACKQAEERAAAEAAHVEREREAERLKAQRAAEEAADREAMLKAEAARKEREAAEALKAAEEKRQRDAEEAQRRLERAEAEAKEREAEAVRAEQRRIENERLREAQEAERRAKDPAGFRFVVVERDAPYGISVCTPSHDMLMLGASRVESYVLRYAEALHSGNWPSYPPFVAHIEPKPWDIAALGEAVTREQYQTKGWAA